LTIFILKKRKKKFLRKKMLEKSEEKKYEIEDIEILKRKFI